MKLDTPKDVNYCATVIRVKSLVELPGLDNLVAIPIFGLQALVSKDVKVGDWGIIFPAEVQLSPEFTSQNNLFRHSEQNADKTAKGYLEDNRRVRAIKLRGHRSDALFMSWTSLTFALGNQDFPSMGEGAQFDTLNGVEICRKYVRKVREPRQQQPGKKAEPRVDPRLFPEMFDQTHWLRIDRNIAPETPLIVTQKLHGTSIRVGHTLVKRKLSFKDRLAKLLGAKVQSHEYAYVFGSRKVIKDANNPNQQHFYDSDLWTAEGKRLEGLIPKGYIVYAEIVGWTEGGSPIQSHYTYNQLPGTRKLYVYRVTHVNEDGVVCDLSWEAIKNFCVSTGLDRVREMWRGEARFFVPEMWIDRIFNTFDSACMRDEPVALSADSPCDEGVCIRIEGMTPEIYKHKSPMFLQHETKMLDNDSSTDVEADEG